MKIIIKQIKLIMVNKELIVLKILLQHKILKIIDLGIKNKNYIKINKKKSI